MSLFIEGEFGIRNELVHRGRVWYKKFVHREGRCCIYSL